MRRATAAAFIVLATTATPAVASDGYFFTMGLFVRKAPSELGNLDGLSRGMYQARILDAPQGLFDQDIGLGWRAGVELGSPLFFAVDAAFGVVSLPDGVQTAPFREGSSATLLAVAGLRERVGRTVLGVELAGGFRQFTYCLGESVETHDYYSGFQKVAEGRVRAEQRLTRSASIGANLGTSLIDPGAWVGGLDVTFRPH